MNQTVKTFVYDEDLFTQFANGDITMEEYMGTAERGPDLTITTEEQEIKLDDLLIEVKRYVGRCNDLFVRAHREKQGNNDPSVLEVYRNQYKYAYNMLLDKAHQAVELYAPHCKKCKGARVFPKYMHINGGKCFSCNNPQLSLNVIFKDMDVQIGGKVRW